MKRASIGVSLLLVFGLSTVACNKQHEDQLPTDANQSHWVVVSAGDDVRNAHKDWAVHWRKVSLQNSGTGKQYNTTVWTFEPEAKAFTTLAPSQTLNLEPDDHGEAWYVKTPAGEGDSWGAVILRNDGGSDRDVAASYAISQEQTKRVKQADDRRWREAKAALEDGSDYIGFNDFYAKVNSVGLPVGKRYHFASCFGETLQMIYDPNLNPVANTCDFKTDIAIRADFDDRSQQEAVLKQLANGHPSICTVVASIEHDGLVHVHRVGLCESH